MASTTAIQDRHCIASKGQDAPLLSINDLGSCCQDTCGNKDGLVNLICEILNTFYLYNYSCDGGYSLPPWRHWVHNGIVTAGNF